MSHPHTRVDDAMCSLLRELSRARCPRPHCGVFRQVGCPRCPRCRTRDPVVGIVVGCVSPGGINTALPTADSSQANDPPGTAEEPAVIRDPLSAEVQVPENWTARVQQLPGATNVHIPAALRGKAAEAFNEGLAGMLMEPTGWATLMEGFPKLVFGKL